MARTNKHQTPAQPRSPARNPVVPAAQPLKTDAERVMVLMALVSQGAQSAEVRQACEELHISPDVVRQTFEGLEQNARVLRAVFEMLVDDPDDDEDD